MPRGRYDPVARGMMQSLTAPKPKPQTLRTQAQSARSLAISGREIGSQGLASQKAARAITGGAKVRLKAAKSGVKIGEFPAMKLHERAAQSHRSPLRKLEQKIQKLARRFDPIAAKKLPKGPRTLLGSFAVPEIVRKMTERVQSLESKSKYKALKEGGYLPRGGGDA